MEYLRLKNQYPNVQKVNSCQNVGNILPKEKEIVFSLITEVILRRMLTSIAVQLCLNILNVNLL